MYIIVISHLYTKVAYRNDLNPQVNICRRQSYMELTIQSKEIFHWLLMYFVQCVATLFHDTYFN